jgi:hypothetical protein
MPATRPARSQVVVLSPLPGRVIVCWRSSRYQVRVVVPLDGFDTDVFRCRASQVQVVVSPAASSMRLRRLPCGS